MTDDSYDDADSTAVIGTAIRRWFDAHIANSPVSRSVDALNHLRASFGALEAEIIKTFNPET